MRKQVEDVWGEDEDYPRSHWKYEVAEGYTNLGYWDWVEHQKEMEEEITDGTEVS